jgi:hypothetical protein
VIWDCPPNCSTRFAPDRVWFFTIDDKVVTIHLEVDENGLKHENSDARIAHIQDSMNSDESWLVRFHPGTSSDGRPACVVRKCKSDGQKYYQKASGLEWNHRLKALTDVISHIYEQIHLGISPTETTWKTAMFF